MARGAGFPVLITTVLESMGVLNEGTAALSKGETPKESAIAAAPIKSPALNVPRVGGFATAIAAMGAAALSLFKVEKATDPESVVAAAYAATGFIVGAALIAAAVIISADIRARAVATAPPADDGDPSPSAETPAVAGFIEGWGKAIDRLKSVASQLPIRGERNEYSKLWMDAKASTGFSEGIEPSAELRDEHARLLAGQERVCELLEELRTDQSDARNVCDEIKSVVDEMQSTLNTLA